VRVEAVSFELPAQIADRAVEELEFFPVADEEGRVGVRHAGLGQPREFLDRGEVVRFRALDLLEGLIAHERFLSHRRTGEGIARGFARLEDGEADHREHEERGGHGRGNPAEAMPGKR
jgi:hypothetical protein